MATADADGVRVPSGLRAFVEQLAASSCVADEAP